MLENKVVKVMTSGGLLSLAESPVYKLRLAISRANKEGWNVNSVLDDYTNNFFIRLLHALILIMTLFIWCPSRAYILILEREVGSYGASSVGATHAETPENEFKTEQIKYCRQCKQEFTDVSQNFCNTCGGELEFRSKKVELF